MLKPQRAGFVLAILLALCMDSFGQSQIPFQGSGDTDKPQQTQSKSDQQATANKFGTEQLPFIVRSIKGKVEAAKDERDRKDKAFNDNITIFLSAAVTIGTLLQATALLTIIRTTRRQLRAYIGVSVKHPPKVNVGTVPRVVLNYKNFGQTPAREVRNWANIIIEPHPSIPRFELEPFSPDRFTINPADLRNIDISLNRVLTQNEVDMIRNDIARIYVYGEFCYFDVFGELRSTTFRLMYGGQRMIEINAMAMCADGNSAT
jgi:hypothetical protein